jgi:hypothetical protein
LPCTRSRWQMIIFQIIKIFGGRQLNREPLEQ